MLIYNLSSNIKNRENIDPEGVKSDTELWEALEKAQLKRVVTELEAGLGKT